jgi:D-sedoheptulose 7-phosphate isomerase
VTADGAGFLYPFIEAQERDAGPLLADLAASARSKARESAALQRATLAGCAGQLAACAAAMARRFAGGGRLYTFGNGGSATDCATFASLFAQPPRAQAQAPQARAPQARAPQARAPQARAVPARPLPALSLAADQAVVTALGNDVGFDLVFSRQIIAHATAGDIAVAFSTSGSSADLLAALGEASRRGLLTVGLAGYDGGEMARPGAVDYCFTVRSQSVHRVQETQALVGYRLWEAVQEALTGPARAQEAGR